MYKSNIQPGDSIQLISALLLLFFMATGIDGAQATDTISFPGAEGAGQFTKDDRGGDVNHVTTPDEWEHSADLNPNYPANGNKDRNSDGCTNLEEYINSLTQTNQPTIAFPGAEGYGRFAKGGRGGDVYIVTNLKDDGEGSLRYGIENMDGPRTIVIAISGTIELKDDIKITNSYLTITGQTAPGDGICIKDYGLKFSEVNDVIMRYIRIWMGDQNKGSSSGADCITSSKISNVIFDHISAGWGIDAIHDNRAGGNFTLQWSIYGETLHDSILACSPKTDPYETEGIYLQTLR